MEINKGRSIVNRLLGNTENDVDDDDIQIHQANVKIGLKCPISLQRIKLPTKGETCKHADVGLFIYYCYALQQNYTFAYIHIF